MKKILLLVVVYLLILAIECARRHRRQYTGYGYAQQYGSQYGLYGPGGQRWMNNPYSNQQGYNWNNIHNMNQGNRRPEWYYNTANIMKSSILCFVLCILYILIV